MRRAVLALGTMGVLASASCAAGEDVSFYQSDIGGSAGRSGAAGSGGATVGTSAGTTVGTTGASGSTGFGGQTVGSGGSANVDASTSAGAGGAGGSSNGGAGGAPGGAAGSTGSTGSGGSTSDAGVDRVVPVTKGFVLFYQVGIAGAMADSIQCEISIHNMGTDTVSLADLTARYYFVDQIANAPQVDINYAHLQATPYRDLVGDITSQVKPWTSMAQFYGKADTYVEIGFSSAAGSIAPGEQAVVDWKFHAGNYQTFNQANDYSFDPTKTTSAQWDHITILRAGNVIWGTAP